MAERLFMIRSMTGYSTSRAESDHLSVSVSLKSTNHRYLDVQMRLPAALEFFEPEARRLLKSRFRRGHLEAAINLEQDGAVAPKINRKLLEAYLRTCQAVREEFGLASEPDLASLLRIPGIIAGTDEFREEEKECAQAASEKALAEAIERLDEMREREGRELARDLETRLTLLEKLVLRVKNLSGQVVPGIRQRLERRIRDLVPVEGVDNARIAQEITMLSLRSDITEEVTRFESHVAQAKHLLTEEQEVGKKLDFLLQEMNREANTMLAKTTDVPGAGAEIAASAIEMKAEIEKLREQAQNIE
jgi:uncharacterized protein (TIGR00255 family)